MGGKGLYPISLEKRKKERLGTGKGTLNMPKEGNDNSNKEKNS